MRSSDLLWFLGRFGGVGGRSRGLRFVTTVSILGLAIGVAAMTVTLAILSGFDREYKRALLLLTSHAVILGAHEIQDPEAVIEKLETVSDVVGVHPFVMGEGILSFNGRVVGAAVKGVDARRIQKVLALESLLQPAMPLTQALAGGAVAQTILGKTLAKRLGCHDGDIVQLIVTREGQGPQRYPLRVSTEFSTGMHEFDSRFAFVDLAVAQKIFLQRLGISGLEVAVKDPGDIQRMGPVLKAHVERPLFVMLWTDLNANLFAALKLEKIVFFLVLLPIVLVGGLTVVACLVMFTVEKRPAMAVLRAIGFPRAWVFRLLIGQGLWIGLTGILLGFGIGSAINLILAHTNLIPISPQVYFIDHLPIAMTALDYALIGAVTMLICLVATLRPALQAARLQPVEGLRGV